jgi:hypothetical protein
MPRIRGAMLRVRGGNASLQCQPGAYARALARARRMGYSSSSVAQGDARASS